MQHQTSLIYHAVSTRAIKICHIASSLNRTLTLQQRQASQAQERTIAGILFTSQPRVAGGHVLTTDN